MWANKWNEIFWFYPPIRCTLMDIFPFFFLRLFHNVEILQKHIKRRLRWVERALVDTQLHFRLLWRRERLSTCFVRARALTSGATGLITQHSLPIRFVIKSCTMLLFSTANRNLHLLHQSREFPTTAHQGGGEVREATVWGFQVTITIIIFITITSWN